MSRYRSVLIVLSGFLASVLFGPATPAAAAVVPEGFETGFGDWHPDTDRQDDGTTWVERKVAVAPGTTVRFTGIGLTEQTAGWAPYGMTRTVTADASGIIWVAVGTSVLWESLRHHFIDHVGVEVRAIGLP